MFIIFSALIAPLLLLVYLAWRWLERAVCLVVFLIPIYLLRTSLFDIPTNTFELSVITLLVVFLLRPASRSSLINSLKTLPRSIVILSLLFLLSAIISTAISDVPRVSLGILKSWTIIPLLFAWLIISVSSLIPHYSFLITRHLIASGTAVAVVSLLFFEPGQRLAGIYDVPNSLALFLAPIIVLTLAQAVTGNNKYRLLLAGIIMFVALILTQSVAGLVSTLLVLSGAGLIYWRRQSQFPAPQFGAATDPSATTKIYSKSRFYILIAIFFLTFLSFGYLFQVGRLQYFLRPIIDPSTNTSFSVRLQLWDISWELIKQNPILGVGLGQFEPHYQQVLHDRFKHFETCALPNQLETEGCRLKNDKQPIAEWVFRDPHSWPLSFWLNMGILGLFSFTGLNIYVFWLTLKKPNKKSPSSLIPHPSLVVTQFSLLVPRYSLHTTHYTLLTILIFGLVDTIYWKNDLAALYWVLLSLLLIESELNLAPSFTDRAQPQSGGD